MSRERPDRFGRYVVLRKIASGGMADVYLCRYEGEEGFRKRFAVKAVHPRFSGDPRFRDLFAREARLAASFSHPNLVQVFDFGREGHRHFLVMEYVAGWNLAQAAAAAAQHARPVPIGVWRHWVLGILSAVNYLHGRGVVHRDLSPSNVLLARDGTVKVADFGVALAGRWESPAEAAPVGKAGYLAPEVAAAGAASASSDLFAAAVIAAELLLQRRLFGGDSRDEIMAAVLAHDERALALDRIPPSLRPAIARGLAADPARRHASAAEFADAIVRALPEPAQAGELEAYWDGLFPPAGEDETVASDGGLGGGAAAVREDRVPYGRGSRRLLRAGIASALAVSGAAGVLWWRGRSEPARPAILQPALEAAQDVAAQAKNGGPHPAGGAQAELQPRKERGRAQNEGDTGTGVPLPGPGGGKGAAAGKAAGEPGAGGVKDAGPSVLLETDPAGAAVVLEDGTRLGKTPMPLDLRGWRAGRIALELDGYERKVVPVELLAGIPRLRVELERLSGTVELIQAIPWARVYDGDVCLGDTPLSSVALSAGAHRLRFVNEPLGVQKSETIVVRPGRNPRIIVDMVSGAPQARP